MSAPARLLLARVPPQRPPGGYMGLCTLRKRPTHSLGAQHLPRVLELAASKAAYFPAFDRAGAGYVPEP